MRLLVTARNISTCMKNNKKVALLESPENVKGLNTGEGGLEKKKQKP